MTPYTDRLSPAGLSVTEKSEAASLSRILVINKPRFAQLIQRMLAGQFEVVSAEDPLKSLKAIQAHEPDVILADLQSGNGLTLAELLDTNVAVPHTPFILMCIQPQVDLVDRARKVGVDALVVKPFPPSSLIERIGAVMKARPKSADVRDEHSKRGVADLIKAHPRTFESLGPLPDTHVKIMRLEKSEGSRRDDIAEQIEMDPDFANTLLRLANAFTDLFPRKVESLRQAVSFVGFQTIANQAMALHIFRLLGEYKSTSKLDIELCFMAGLLHDVGKLILD